MINRIVEIADTSARLKIRNHCLVVCAPSDEESSIPIREVGVLLMSNPAISLTQPVLAELASQGAMVVVTGNNHVPQAMMLPLGIPATQAEIFRIQAQVSLPVMKRAWQQVVQAKLTAQAAVLKAKGRQADLLEALVSQVRSGDPDNIEARSAKYYWHKLFDGVEFKRNSEGDGINALLNYGYGVLRAIVARAVCSSGLHPALGIHHHNRYDNYCLASDLMEPFRPLVDRGVIGVVGDGATHHVELSRDNRQHLLNLFSGRMVVEGRPTTFFQGVSRLTASLVDVYMKNRSDLVLPEKLWDEGA